MEVRLFLSFETVQCFVMKDNIKSVILKTKFLLLIILQS